MASAELRRALSAHLEAVATYLQSEVASGAEVQFELEQHGGRRGSRRPALYCYQPLTAQFIAQREGALRALPTHRDAARELAEFGGLDAYLLSAGIDPPAPVSACVQAALTALTEEVFAEQSSFELEPERLRGALARIDGALQAEGCETTLLATLHGLALASQELELTSELRICRADAATGLPPGALSGCAGEDGEGAGEHLLVLLSGREQGPHSALARGRELLGELLGALRLFGDSRITLGRLAWLRVRDGAWRPLALGIGGRPAGVLLVAPDQEDELRAFCNLVARRAPHGDVLAWALRRYQLGCERDRELEALSDHLLALRALLEPEPEGGATLARRLSTLCAASEERDELAGRIEAALALERAAREGAVDEGGAERALARELADHLRALLRDVICGHLQPDLAALADELTPAGTRILGARTDADADAPADEDRDTGAGAASSIEEILSDPGQAEQILDVLI
jgi:hypothetical protein